MTTPNQPQTIDSTGVQYGTERASLSGLPEELLHQILTFLPADSLLLVSRVSRTFHRLHTANSLWRPHVLLLPHHIPATHEIDLIPSCLWSFAHAPDGWYRAYRSLMRVLHEPWLSQEKLAGGGEWLVYFKNSGGSGGGVDLRRWASRVVFEEVEEAGQVRREVRSVGGARMPTRRWWVEEGVMRVPAYPDNRPCRDPLTKFRKFEHTGVMMVSDDPEFVEALARLNREILEEAVRTGEIRCEEARSRQDALEKARRERIPMDAKLRVQRLLAAINRAYEEQEAEMGVYAQQQHQLQQHHQQMEMGMGMGMGQGIWQVRDLGTRGYSPQW